MAELGAAMSWIEAMGGGWEIGGVLDAVRVTVVVRRAS